MTDRSFRRLSPLTPVVKGFLMVVAAVSALWRDAFRGDVGPFAGVLVVLLVAGAVLGLASWYRTKFWIESDELRVDTGVISRQSRRIRIDRIQGIDIVQPFVARFFGLAELRMDVAGGGSREGTLAFLSLADARDFKDVLLARRDEVRARREGEEVTASGAGGVPATVARPARESVIARVDHGTLLWSILLSGETLGGLVALLSLAAAAAVTGQWVGLSGLLPVLAGVVLVQFKRFSASYRFTVSETAAGLQVRRGLFDLSSQTVALHRVQGVVVSEPLLWRPFGWARIDVSIAGYASGGETDSAPAASVVLPVGDRGLVSALAQHVLGGRDPGSVSLVPAPARARWLAPVGQPFLAAGIGGDVAVSREGWFNRRTHAVPHERVQSVRITQGPRERLAGLATLVVDSPPGPVSVRARHRRVAEVRRLMEQEVQASGAARVPVEGGASAEGRADSVGG